MLDGLVEEAREAVVPTGFLAAITKGQAGGELTEMGELADRGAAGFTDDGRPVASAGVMRRALQYAAVAGRTVAVHCEEPSPTRRPRARGHAVSAELGFGGYPSLGESLMVERDLALAGYEGGRSTLMHLSARESVEALACARGGRRGDGRGHAAPPRAHRRGRAHARPEPEDEPAAQGRARPAALLAALRSGDIGAVASDHAPHARHEKDVPFEAAPFGVTGLETAFAALHTHLVEPGLLDLETLLVRMSDGPARAFGLEPPRRRRRPREPRPARPRRELAGGGRGFRSRSANSWLGETLLGRVRMTVADGAVVHAA